MKSENIKSIKEELSERVSTEDGCPLCSMMMDYEFNQIAHIQYEVSNNKNIREMIASEGGFCDFHFRQFRKIANGKTNISLLKSIIEVGAYKKENFQIECRLCKSVNEYEYNLLRVFTEFLSEKEKRTQHEKTNGICFIHLKQVKYLIEDENIKGWLQKIHIEQIERMRTDFDFMNALKSFYEIDRKKRKLINILIEKLAGRKIGGL
jgi:hypothetical protein